MPMSGRTPPQWAAAVVVSAASWAVIVSPCAAADPTPSGFPNLDGMADVSTAHTVTVVYPLATFTSPTGLQCAMWSSLGDTAAVCYGPLPGLTAHGGKPADRAYADDRTARFEVADQPPAPDKLGGRPLKSGEKVVLGAGGTLMQGDQITCGVQDTVVACELINGFADNHGDPTAHRTGFVLDRQGSWTF
jgi:hypothetical protein